MTPPAPLGAYGVAWPDLPSVDAFLQPVEPGGPTIRTLRVTGPTGPVEDGFGFGADRAVLGLGRGRSITMDRTSGEVCFAVDEEISEAALVHPYLGFPSAVFNRWAGRDSFHAGAVVVGGRAIMVAGHKEAGKSTTLALLGARGLDVLADDVLTLDRMEVLPGPRCVDLRPEAARRLELGEPLGVLGARERWRVGVGPVAPHRLGGIVYLGWGPEVTLTPLPGAERLRRLFEFDALEIGPVDPSTYMDLAQVPAWELTRPRSLEATQPSLDRLLDAVAG